jgi:hypothetical protein
MESAAPDHREVTQQVGRLRHVLAGGVDIQSRVCRSAPPRRRQQADNERIIRPPPSELPMALPHCLQN